MIKKIIRAAVIQFDCPNEKVRAVDTIARLIEEAAETKPDLILLAETAFTPYTTVDDFLPVAEPIPGPFTDRLSLLARRHRAYLCCGVVELENGKPYNTAVLFSPDGELIHTYRKTNLAPTDKASGFAPGTSGGIVKTDLGNIGILICLDTDDLELVQAMAKSRPDLLLVPAYGLAKYDYRSPQPIDCMVDECIDEWRLRMQTVAKTCRSYLLRADHCGLEERQVRVGHSIAVSPGGYVIAEATMKPAILRVELDPASPSPKKW